VAWAKKIIQLSVCPINGMLVTITHNVLRIGEEAVAQSLIELQMFKISTNVQ
jgi:hypothetical protein